VDGAILPQKTTIVYVFVYDLAWIVAIGIDFPSDAGYQPMGAISLGRARRRCHVSIEEIVIIRISIKNFKRLMVTILGMMRCYLSASIITECSISRSVQSDIVTQAHDIRIC
jgi:hypothetical protein